MWNVKTFACIATLKGHNHWVRALCVSNGILYSGCHNLIKAPLLPRPTHLIYSFIIHFYIYLYIYISIEELDICARSMYLI